MISISFAIEKISAKMGGILKWKRAENSTLSIEGHANAGVKGDRKGEKLDDHSQGSLTSSRAAMPVICEKHVYRSRAKYAQNMKSVESRS